MNDNPLEVKVKGRSFSGDDRGKVRIVIKRIIEKFILPFIERKIKTLENAIAPTRKGKLNQFKSLFKKAERGDNEGMKESFKVN
jgi:hypothetical protein